MVAPPVRSKTFRVPKNWHSDLIRTRLIEELGESAGENEYQKLVTVIFRDRLAAPTRVEIPATPAQIQTGIDLLTKHEKGDYLKLAQAARGWQRWFSLHPKAAKGYLVWAKAELPGEEVKEPRVEVAQTEGNDFQVRSPRNGYPVIWEDDAHTHGTRKCNTCNQDKSVNTEDKTASEFYLNANGSPHARCKDCTAIATSERKRAAAAA